MITPPPNIEKVVTFPMESNGFSFAVSNGQTVFFFLLSSCHTAEAAT